MPLISQQLLLLNSLDVEHNLITQAFYGSFRSLTQLNVKSNPMPIGAFASFEITSDDSQQILDPGTNLTCPNRFVFLNDFVTFPVQLLVEPRVLNYTHCHCPDSMRWSVLLSRCLSCPDNYRCSTATDDAFSGTALVAATGYYPVANGTFCAQFASVIPSPVALDCLVPSSCNPDLTPVFACGYGLDSSSLLCSKCLPSYHPVGQTCVACHASFVALVPLSGVVMCVALAIFAWRKRYLSQESAVLAIALLWIQVTSLLQDQSITQQSTGPNNSGILKVESIWGLQQLLSFRPWSLYLFCSSGLSSQPFSHYRGLCCAKTRVLNCLISVDFASDFWSFVIGVFVAYALLALRWTLGPRMHLRSIQMRTKHSVQSSAAPADSPSANAQAALGEALLTDPAFAPVPQTALDTVVSASSVDAQPTGTLGTALERFGFLLVFALDLAYLPVSTALLQTFQCVDRQSEAGVTYLQAYPYMSCNTAQYRAMLGVAITGFICFSLAWPVYLYCTIRPHSSALDQCSFRHEFGFLVRQICS